MLVHFASYQSVLRARLHARSTSFRSHLTKPRNTDARPLIESRRATSRKNLLGDGLGDAVRQGEGKVLLEELLDVRALYLVRAGDFGNLEDLKAIRIKELQNKPWLQT